MTTRVSPSERIRAEAMSGPLAERGARYSIVYRATDPQTGHTKQVSRRDWESKEAVEGPGRHRRPAGHRHLPAAQRADAQAVLGG
jgi:hypothetical protein